MKFLPSKGIRLTQPQLVIVAFGLILVSALLALPAVMILRGQARTGDTNPTVWPTLDEGMAGTGAAIMTLTGPASTPSAPAVSALSTQPSITPTPVLGATMTAPPLVPTTYTVQQGDSLSSIAARYGVTLDALLAANGFTMQTVITPGQEIT